MGCEEKKLATSAWWVREAQGRELGLGYVGLAEKGHGCEVAGWGPTILSGGNWVSNAVTTTASPA